jgi:hypothetical protein
LNADLDGDDHADAVDARLCDAALGNAPGPSGFALPIVFVDADRDGIGDVADNCAHAANPDQADRGGVGAGSAPDGIGDACQCGDVNGSGSVTLADAVALSRSMLVPPTGVVTRPELCDVNGIGGCTLSDAVVVRRALLAPATAQILPQCAAAKP